MSNLPCNIFFFFSFFFLFLLFLVTCENNFSKVFKIIIVFTLFITIYRLSRITKIHCYKVFLSRFIVLLWLEDPICPTIADERRNRYMPSLRAYIDSFIKSIFFNVNHYTMHASIALLLLEKTYLLFVLFSSEKCA